MNWIDWLGVGVATWLLLAVPLALAFARMFARAMSAAFDPPEKGA